MHELATRVRGLRLEQVTRMEAFTARVDRIRWKQEELTRGLEAGVTRERPVTSPGHRFDAIAVHQMGKVGSMSLYEAVRSVGRWPCFHTHVLDPFHGAFRVSDELVIPAAARPHIYDSRELRSQYLNGEGSIGVISAIREPIARNLSAFFTNLDRFVGPDPVELDDADALYERFRGRFPHDQPDRWLSSELNKVFGIDVFASPFPAQGSAVIDADPHCILVMRTSLPDEAKTRVLCTYLGLQGLHIGRTNTTAGKPGLKSTYLNVRRLVGRDRGYIDAMLGLQMSLHFFTAQEREEIRERWLAIGKASRPVESW